MAPNNVFPRANTSVPMHLRPSGLIRPQVSPDVMNIKSILNHEEHVNLPVTSIYEELYEASSPESSVIQYSGSESSVNHSSSSLSRPSTTCNSPASGYSTDSGPNALVLHSCSKSRRSASCKVYRRTSGYADRAFRSNVPYTMVQIYWIMYHREDVRTGGKINKWDEDKGKFDEEFKELKIKDAVVPRGKNNQGIQQIFYRRCVYPFLDKNGEPLYLNGEMRMLPIKARQRSSRLGHLLKKLGYFSFIRRRPDLASASLEEYTFVTKEHKLLAAQIYKDRGFTLMPGAEIMKPHGFYKWVQVGKEWVVQIDHEKERAAGF